MATLNLAKLETASIILNGEKVAVKKILKVKQEVIMANGERLPLENIRAVGRGFVYDAPVKASTKKPAATAASSAKAPAAKAPAMGNANGNPLGRGAPVTADDLIDKNVTTKDGEKLAVETVLSKKGIVKLAGNVRVELANIVRRGRGFVELDITDVEAKPTSTKPAAKVSSPKVSSPKVSVTPGHMAIEPKQLRGARVKVGGRYETVEKIFGAKGQVMTDKGTRLEVANIHQKGTKYIYTEVEAAPVAKPAAKTETKPAPSTGGIRRREEPVDVSKPAGKTERAPKATADKSAKVKKVTALTADLTEEIRVLADDTLQAAIAKAYDLKYVTSGAIFNNEVVTLELTFAVGSYTPKQIAALLADLKSEEDDSDDFDDSELTGNDDDDDADDSEDDDSEDDDADDSEDDDSEDDDSEDDDSEDDDSEDDDSEDDDSEDDDSEESDDDEDDEFENDADEDDDSDDDIDAKVDAGVAALEKKFGKHSSFKAYAENYLLSEEVEKAFGDEMTVGVTKLKTEKGVYVLVGLHEDGDVIMINGKTSKLKKSTIAAVARMEEV